MAAEREPVIRALTMCVDCVIRSFIDILRSVVAPAGASRATLAIRWNEIRIRHLLSTPRAGSEQLIEKDLSPLKKGVLWTFDTRLRHIDSGGAIGRPVGMP